MKKFLVSFAIILAACGDDPTAPQPIEITVTVPPSDGQQAPVVVEPADPVVIMPQDSQKEPECVVDEQCENTEAKPICKDGKQGFRQTQCLLGYCVPVSVFPWPCEYGCSPEKGNNGCAACNDDLDCVNYTNGPCKEHFCNSQQYCEERDKQDCKVSVCEGVADDTACVVVPGVTGICQSQTCIVTLSTQCVGSSDGVSCIFNEGENGECYNSACCSLGHVACKPPTSGDETPFCGDTQCTGDENCSTCQVDCGQCVSTEEGIVAYHDIDPTQKYYIRDGQRWTFIGDAALNSWYPDGVKMKAMTADELSLSTLIGNIFIRPGTFLVQEETYNVIYGVEPKGFLQPICTIGENEENCAAVAGADWVNRLLVLPTSQVALYDGKTVMTTPAPTIGQVVFVGQTTIDNWYIVTGYQVLSPISEDLISQLNVPNWAVLVLLKYPAIMVFTGSPITQSDIPSLLDPTQQSKLPYEAH